MILVLPYKIELKKFLNYKKYLNFKKIEYKSFDEFKQIKENAVYINPIFYFIDYPKGNKFDDFNKPLIFFNFIFKDDNNFNIIFDEKGIIFRINNKCLNKCEYCHLKVNNFGDFKNFDLLKKYSEKHKNIVILGEIFLEKNCQEILDFLNNKFKDITIFTSFYNFSKQFNTYNFCIVIIEHNNFNQSLNLFEIKEYSDFFKTEDKYLKIKYNNFLKLFKTF